MPVGNDGDEGSPAQLRDSVSLLLDQSEGGISCIVETHGGLGRGAICRIRRDEIEALDALENVAEDLYRRDSFRVLGDDGAWHIADLYRVARPAAPSRHPTPVST
ncbi:MAG: gamma-glutamylcyclotransferase [Rhodospirillales bacterium]|nr:gamma-glutamylcyclotransferase [Rhodospirillales bacterium]